MKTDFLNLNMKNPLIVAAGPGGTKTDTASERPSKPAREQL